MHMKTIEPQSSGFYVMSFSNRPSPTVGYVDIISRGVYTIKFVGDVVIHTVRNGKLITFGHQPDVVFHKRIEYAIAGHTHG